MEKEKTMTMQQKLHLRKLIRELKSYKAPHTEFVSVYVPAGYELFKITQHLAEEQGTASNIKSASTRKNVQGALEKMIQHLRTIGRTPANGLAVFCGNLLAGEGKQDFRVWSMEPPLPLNTRIYRCDKNFVTDILEEMMVEHTVYGLVVMDRRDAILALLKGKTIVPLQKTHSEVPGKHRAGGQCHVFGTLVQSASGSILKIENCHNPIIVKSMVIDNYSIQDSPITDKWTVQKPEIYKITTKYPQLVVESSKDHLFFVSTEQGVVEKAAEELKPGDNLIMPEKIKIVGKIQKLNSKKYYNCFSITNNGQKLLREKRLERGISQKKLAKIMNTFQAIISSFEVKEVHFSPNRIKKLCQQLGIDFDYFLENFTTPYLYSNIKLPTDLNEELAQFLGYYLGDGSLEKDRITFFEQREEVALKYKQKFDNYFKLNSSHRFRESKNYHQLKFTSRPLVRLLQGEFPELKKTLDPEIPTKILESPNNIVANFLRGLFDAEGYTSVRKQVALGINNKLLAQQIQMVLLRFGIIASLHEYDNKNNPYSKKHRFTIDITEKESLRLFKEDIGFTSNDKSKKLMKAISNKTEKSMVRQVIVPGTEIRKIIEKAGYNTQLFPKVNDFFRNKKMMSKNVFKSSILNYVSDKKLYRELEEIYNYPILPVKIHKIEKIYKTVPMVDISVGNQNFIANGIIVHNSAQRFARLREGSLKEHYKKICEYMKDQFLPLGNNLKGIIVGGPGTTINDFLNHEYLTGDLKKKILGTKDLSYTDEFGLQELLDKCGDLLAEEEVAREKKIMEKFFKQFMENPKKIVYGEKETIQALERNAVGELLLSETLPEDRIFELEEQAQKGGADVKIISVETREGVQLRDLGGIAGILRYEME